ncbi:hypothetical protein PS1_007798 [Malus domestica]
MAERLKQLWVMRDFGFNSGEKIGQEVGKFSAISCWVPQIEAESFKLLADRSPFCWVLDAYQLNDVAAAPDDDLS